MIVSVISCFLAISQDGRKIRTYMTNRFEVERERESERAREREREANYKENGSVPKSKSELQRTPGLKIGIYPQHIGGCQWLTKRNWNWKGVQLLYQREFRLRRGKRWQIRKEGQSGTWRSYGKTAEKFSTRFRWAQRKVPVPTTKSWRRI